MALKTFDLSKLLEEKPTLTRREKLNFVWNLSIPGMLAQISSILMQYIDAAMVGGLGENASAAIGLVASSTWVIGSLTNSLAVGYTVQVAHAVGEGNQNKAKRILIKSIISCLIFSLLLATLASAISGNLPGILGGSPQIKRDASIYFLIFALSTPLYQFIYLLSGMLQCSGNMKVPAILNSTLCLLDAGFNVLFIKVFGLGVMGAALGTACSALVVALLMGYFALVKSEYLGIRGGRMPVKTLDKTGSSNCRTVRGFYRCPGRSNKNHRPIGCCGPFCQLLCRNCRSPLLHAGLRNLRCGNNLSRPEHWGKTQGLSKEFWVDNGSRRYADYGSDRSDYVLHLSICVQVANACGRNPGPGCNRIKN